MKAYGELLDGDTSFRAPVLDAGIPGTAASQNHSHRNCNRSAARWPCMTPAT